MKAIRLDRRSAEKLVKEYPDSFLSRSIRIHSTRRNGTNLKRPNPNQSIRNSREESYPGMGGQ